MVSCHTLKTQLNFIQIDTVIRRTAADSSTLLSYDRACHSVPLTSTSVADGVACSWMRTNRSYLVRLIGRILPSSARSTAQSEWVSRQSSCHPSFATSTVRCRWSNTSQDIGILLLPSLPTASDTTSRRHWDHNPFSAGTCNLTTGLLQRVICRFTVIVIATLQRVQNVAARLIFDLRKTNHVTPCLLITSVRCIFSAIPTCFSRVEIVNFNFHALHFEVGVLVLGLICEAINKYKCLNDHHIDNLNIQYIATVI